VNEARPERVAREPSPEKPAIADRLAKVQGGKALEQLEAKGVNWKDRLAERIEQNRQKQERKSSSER